MKSRVVAGMLGLALAGCAQGRSTFGPVGVRPVPTLRDSINAGLPADPAPTPAVPAPIADSPRPPQAPVEVGEAPSLRETINAGMPVRDTATQRAGQPQPDAPPTSATKPVPGPSEAVPAIVPQPPTLPPLPPTVPLTAPAEPTPPPAQPEATPPAPPADMPPPPVDPAIQPTRAELPRPEAASRPAEVRSRVDSGSLIGLTVATVGNEKISLPELQDVVREWVRANVPKGQPIAHDQLNELASNLLEQLIDRALFIEEANRVLLKGDKQRKMFLDFVDKQWKEREVPNLIQRYKVKNEQELRQALQQNGRSLDLVRERYRKETMAKEFLHHQLQERLARPELREMWTYYQEHIKAFDRPAQVTWREITVKVTPQVDRTTARRRTEEVLNRLRRGEDFATLAKSSSQGPTASKGGFWQTEPNASAVEAVNEAIASLPLNQVSGLLEAPDGFHIVRVEGRRAAGPAPFVEVQDKVRETLVDLAFQREVDAFTKRLRAQTLITYYIKDGVQPAAAGRDGQAQRTSASR